MKIVQINTFSNGSTGKIMLNIHEELKNKKIDSYVVWARGREPKNDKEYVMGSKLDVYLHGIYTRLTDKTGFLSKNSTKELLKKLDEIKPDIIHLHNIHGYYINIELLFNYIRKNNIKVIWTLHDCWTFTGHCAYFDFSGCEKWKSGCHNCPELHEYPKSYKDNSKWNYNKKKELFTGLDITLVTPSKWLADLVKQSFLKEYEVIVINNDIDYSIFKPRKSDFRKKYNLEDKKIILGVANDWSNRKGFDDFIKLSNEIDDSIKIVMVGLNNSQLKMIPSNILGIQRTENAIQLAEIYTAADVYFNPTYADNYPTTNIEALACGTQVITYNTGGSTECITDSKFILEKGNYMQVLDILKNMDSNKKVSKYKKDKTMIEEYMDLYKEI